MNAIELTLLSNDTLKVEDITSKMVQHAYDQLLVEFIAFVFVIWIINCFIKNNKEKK